MATHSLFREVRALLTIFLSILLSGGQAFSEIMMTEGHGVHPVASRKASSLPLNLTINNQIKSGDAALAPDAKLLQTRIEALLSPYLTSASFSGDILVVRRGKVLFDKGYGFANLERGTSITPQTKFYIASISKSFTAAAILLLQDRGRLRVTDLVSRFIPDFPNGDRITLHHLLTHTSGLTDYVRFLNFTEISQKFYTTADTIELFRNKPLMFEPGERASYSNSNYVLLARVIEKASGLRYADFLKANFFEPFHMKNTGQPNASDVPVARLAIGYTPTGLHEFETARYFDHSISTGAGSLYSTTEDISKWIQGLFSGRALKKSSVEQMFKPHSDGTSGYSWTLGKLWNRDVITENGWDGVGYAGTLVHFPNDDLTVIVLSNLNISSVTGEVANNVSALVLGEPYTPLTINREPVSTELARKLVGRYKLGDDFYVPGTVMEIIESGGTLYEQQRNPDRLVGLIRISEREFIHRSSWGKMNFELDESGEVTGMLFFDRFKASKLHEK